MKFATLILCLLSSTWAFAGQTGGGGTPAKTLELIDINEMMRVYEGASSISKEVYGIPDNFTLDARNRRVMFEKGFEMTYDEIKKEAPATEPAPSN